jgi:uncharacterized membrane protein YdjX (TVP38/TMEM64 family)
MAGLYYPELNPGRPVKLRGAMEDSNERSDSPRSIRWIAFWACLGIFGALCIAGGLYLWFSADPIIAKYRELARFYSSKKAVTDFLKSFGPYAPIACIVIQALQVVLAPIPGEATGILGGYLFGTWIGFLYSTIGLTLGSVMAFWLGRWLGLPIVRRVVSKEVYHRFDFISRAGGELVTLVCFLIPGFPKDYLCFLLGVSPLQFGMFFMVSTFGRMPGTWLLSVQGAKVRNAQYVEFVIYLLVAAFAVVLAYIYRERIYLWMHRRHSADAAGEGSDRLDL